MSIVWDLPTRVFHWLMVLAVLLLYVSAEFAENLTEYFGQHEIYFDAIVWHSRAGYVLLSLIIFRLCWGFWGNQYSRFSHFPLAPKNTLTYLKNILAGNKPTYAGHNPLGAWSVISLLALLFAQTITGLFADDDIAFSGPLSHLISGDAVETLTSLHRLNFDLLTVFIFLHLIAVALYQFLFKEKIIAAMVHGKKSIDQTSTLKASNWKALIFFALSASLVYWVAT